MNKFEIFDDYGQFPRQRHAQMASGKIIKIVDFSELDAPTEQKKYLLRVCSDCHGDNLQPTLVEKLDNTHWCIGLRCPECQASQERVVSNEEYDEYESILDAARHAIEDDFKQALRHAMVSELRILHDDLNSNTFFKLPEDF